MSPTSPAALEIVLRDLPAHGTLVKSRENRQIWSFAVDGKRYFLKWYPRDVDRWKRRLRGNPALREFVRLQWLQKAKVASPRAVALLNGLRIGERLGDAVILDAIEPAEQLDVYLHRHALAGEPVADRRALLDQVVSVVRSLGAAKLGHADLHLGNFLLSNGKVFLLDAYAVHRGGLTTADLALLGHSATPYTSIAERVRAWQELSPDSPMPSTKSVSRRLYRKILERATRDNRYFGTLEAGEWSGHFFKFDKFPRRWSRASQLPFTADDWRRIWRELSERFIADDFQIFKRSPSGDVLGGAIEVGGKILDVVIKRPRRKTLLRKINAVGRPSRARRMWLKAAKLVARDVPCEWPLLLMERSRLGYAVESVIVFERVPGETLATIDLDALAATDRERLFHRTGRLLRRLESLGFAHFDAKATNWVARSDARLGFSPVLIDLDGVRNYRWDGEGLARLLRSMRSHPQYTPTDSYWLCRGYAPRAKLLQDKSGEESS